MEGARALRRRAMASSLFRSSWSGYTDGRRIAGSARESTIVIDTLHQSPIEQLTSGSSRLTRTLSRIPSRTIRFGITALADLRDPNRSCQNRSPNWRGASATRLPVDPVARVGLDLAQAFPGQYSQLRSRNVSQQRGWRPECRGDQCECLLYHPIPCQSRLSADFSRQ